MSTGRLFSASIQFADIVSGRACSTDFSMQECSNTENSTLQEKKELTTNKNSKICT